MGTSSGETGTTQYNWNPFMENMWGGGGIDPTTGQANPGLLNRAVQNVLNKRYQQYGGQRIASLNGDQNQALANIRQATTGYGSADTAAGRQSAKEIAQGQHLLDNPWSGAEVVGGANKYSGNDNPYARQMLRSQMEDTTNAYNQGTSADLTRMMNLSGAFGGSAHQQAMANNEAALGKNLGNMANQWGNDQYNRSAQLEESALGRSLQAQTTNKSIGSQNYENAAQRQLSAIPLALQGQGLSLQAAQALMGAGDVQRSYGQDLLNLGYSNWQNQQGYEGNQLNWMANLLSQAQGGIGGSQQQTGGGYAANPYSAILGGALAGRAAGLY